jgi:hypothetical protein
VSTLLRVGLLVVTASAAIYVGRYVGRKVIRRWMRAKWGQILGFVFVLTLLWLIIGPLDLSLEYIVLVAIFVGSVVSGVWAQE